MKEVDHLAHSRFGPAEGSVEAFVGDDDASLDFVRAAVCAQFVAEEPGVRNMSELVKQNNEVGLGHWRMLTQDALLWRGWFDAGHFMCRLLRFNGIALDLLQNSLGLVGSVSPLWVFGGGKGNASLK